MALTLEQFLFRLLIFDSKDQITLKGNIYQKMISLGHSIGMHFQKPG